MAKKNFKLYKKIEGILSNRPQLSLEGVVREIWKEYCVKNEITSINTFLNTLVLPNAHLPRYELIKRYYQEIKKKNPKLQTWYPIYRNTIFYLDTYWAKKEGKDFEYKAVLLKDVSESLKFRCTPFEYGISIIQLRTFIKWNWELDNKNIEIKIFAKRKKRVLYMVYDEKREAYVFYRSEGAL